MASQVHASGAGPARKKKKTASAAAVEGQKSISAFFKRAPAETAEAKEARITKEVKEAAAGKVARDARLARAAEQEMKKAVRERQKVAEKALKKEQKAKKATAKAAALETEKAGKKAAKETKQAKKISKKMERDAAKKVAKDAAEHSVKEGKKERPHEEDSQQSGAKAGEGEGEEETSQDDKETGAGMRCVKGAQPVVSVSGVSIRAEVLPEAPRAAGSSTKGPSFSYGKYIVRGRHGSRCQRRSQIHRVKRRAGVVVGVVEDKPRPERWGCATSEGSRASLHRFWASLHLQVFPHLKGLRRLWEVEGEPQGSGAAARAARAAEGMGVGEEATGGVAVVNGAATGQPCADSMGAAEPMAVDPIASAVSERLGAPGGQVGAGQTSDTRVAPTRRGQIRKNQRARKRIKRKAAWDLKRSTKE